MQASYTRGKYKTTINLEHDKLKIKTGKSNGRFYDMCGNETVILVKDMYYVENCTKSRKLRIIMFNLQEYILNYSDPYHLYELDGTAEVMECLCEKIIEIKNKEK